MRARIRPRQPRPELRALIQLTISAAPALTQPQLGRGRRRNCETGLHGLVNKSRDYESKVSAEAAATRPP